MINSRLTKLSFLLIFFVSVGCGNNNTSSINKQQASNNANPSSHDQHIAQLEKAAPSSTILNKESKYTLDASTSKENDSYYLKVNTNFKLSSEHYEGAPVDGEGHIHFYLNGALIGPIKDATLYPIQNLQKGKNTIKLVLAQNNHSETLGVSKELTIESN